jgi:hypothetical protein
MPMRFFRCVLLLLAVASAATARAEPDDPRERAAARYRRGVDLVKQGLYEAALGEFNAAYATRPHFAVLYNIGQAQIALGRPLPAIEALSAYLRDGAQNVPPSRREQVRAQIALLEAKLGELTISTDRPDVAIRVDDRDVGRTPLVQPIRLPAGTHTITASLPDGAQITRVVTVGEAERQRVDLALPGETPAAAEPKAVITVPAVPPAAPPPSDAAATLVSPAPPGARPEAPAARGSTMRRAAYVSAGLGAAAAGAALGVYLWYRDRYEDWQAGEAALQDMTPGSAAYRMQVVANNGLAASLTRANQAIVGLSIAGGLLVATGASLWFVDRGRGRERGAGALAVWCTGSSAQLGWSGRW